MKQLAFIADDFGRSVAINQAIVRAHQEGALTGASLMVGQPATEHAIELAKANPGLHVGWHLHLCDSQSTTRADWPWGASPVRAGMLLGLAHGHRDLVREEIRNQWRLFQDSGLPCRFFNTHHHLHLHPWVGRQLGKALAGSTVPPGWFRGADLRRFDHRSRGSWTLHLGRAAARFSRYAGGTCSIYRHADSVWGIDRLFTMDAGEVAATAAALSTGLHEFIFHPRALHHDADLEALLRLRGIMSPASTRSDPEPGATDSVR